MTRSSAGGRVALVALLGGAGCCVVAGVLVALLGGAGAGFLASRPPSPFAGAGRFEVVLESPDATARADAPAYARRLEAAGVEAQAVPRGDHEIVLTLAGVGDVGGLLDAVLPARRLAFRLASAAPSPFALAPGEAPAPGLRAHAPYGMPTLPAADTAEALAPVLGAHPLPDGLVARVACDSIDVDTAIERTCYPVVLEDPPILGGADVEAAEAGMDDMSGTALVRVELTPPAAARFGEVTGRSVGRKLAIVVDGEVLSFPVIASRIDGGRAQITMGGADPTAAFTEATALAAALQPGASVQGTWAVQSLDLR